MSADPCPSCGAAMADDQRYCLACGERRAEARLDYMEILRGPRPGAAMSGSGAVAAVGVDARARVNTTVIASIGCLLLAMGVGVLIGNAGGVDTAAAPASAPAQVIRVQGGGAAAADTAAAAATTSKKKQASSAKKDAGDVETAATAAESKATNPALTQLENASPEEYQKQSQKLPKTVSTGGKAPPKDNKPAAGGADFEEIG